MRGQKNAGGAASLIGLILLVFVFYILFLPPQAREELLTQNVSDLKDDEAYLLNATPGTVSFTEKNVFDHNLPNIYLEATTQAKVVAQENPFVVQKGWFGEQQKTMVFTLDKLENIDNVLLSFQATRRSGRLVIALNGQRIFEGVVQSQNPAPVRLPVGALLPSNRLDFSVEGGFFETKRYDLIDVKVISDVRDVARQSATASFTISNTEFDNLDTAILDFYPICTQRDIGVLSVELNGRAIFAAAPSCDSLNRQDLFREDLRSGKNTIRFTSEKGSVRVEQMRVRTTLKPVKSVLEYFFVKSSLYNSILDREHDIRLRIEFIDDGSQKRAELSINGKRQTIDQRDNVFEVDLRQQIKEGNNYIELKPLAELDIVKMEVRVD